LGGYAKIPQLEQKVDRLTITTVDGKVTQMGSEVRFSRVVSTPAGPGQQQTASQTAKARPSAPPSPPPAAVPLPLTAVNGNRKHPETAELPKSADHWRQEAQTATQSLMFDTAVSRLENWFQDAKAAASFRDTLFGDWNPNLVCFYLEALLKYAEVRQVLNGRYPTQAAHNNAKIEALNIFNRLQQEAGQN